jgi:hypothetical protein
MRGFADVMKLSRATASRARADADLFTGKEEPIDVSQVAVSMNGIEPPAAQVQAASSWQTP